MSWVAWFFSAGALIVLFIAVFVVWDLVFCGGRRCRELTDRWDEWRP
ncbi:MAG: hypothetical protein L0206_21440 [Actinobacteria bacterium]|nr:hypothetical protein [Actinomycetota bacterium]